MNIKSKKQEYNNILEEYHEGNKYLDDITNPIEEIYKAMPKVRSLARELHEITQWFDNNNVKYTDNEIMEGFSL